MKRLKPLGLVGVLLLLLAARTVYLHRLLDMTVDEVWSVWQTLGTWQDILHWTPFDWPPGYYLILGAWGRLTGLHPITLRYLMLLVFLMGAASMYRVARRVFGEAAGVLALLIFGAFGWSVYASMHLRGHSFTLSLSPVVLWLALRYFDKPRAWWRGVPLGVLMAFMLYIHSTPAVYFAVLGVFTLIVYGWRVVWQWVLPGGLMLLLALPEFISKYALTVSSRMSGFEYPRPPFLEGMDDFYYRYWGRSEALWLVLVGVAVVWLVWHTARQKPRLLIGLAFWCLMPLVFYATQKQLAMLHSRYSLWYMTGFTLLLAGGLSYLPRLERIAAALAVVWLLFTPMDIKDFDAFGENVGGMVSWLAHNVEGDDVIVIDPVVQRAGHMREEWDLFVRAFFPQGLPYAETPDGEQRVWYIRTQQVDEDTLAAVEEGRVGREFYGEITFFARLYEAPPDPDGVRFENGMRFHGAQMIRDGRTVKRHAPIFHEDETIIMRLWWSVDAPLELDYSVGTYVMGDGAVLSSVDSAPQVVSLSPTDDAPPDATSQWQPGTFYIEERELTIPLGAQAVMVSVYQWWDGERVGAPPANDDDLLQITPVGVKAW